MAGLQHPFQCLRYVNRQSAGQSDILIATAGRNLYSYHASNGQRLDVWPQPVDANAEDKSSDAAPASESQGPPEKRRKLSSTSEEQTDAKSESTPKDSKREASNSWTNIPLLTVAHGKYVVIMTSEDKCVRVLNLDAEGKLQQLSARTMPKKLSALTLTPDENNILTGDKFGDVYTFPLIPSGEYVKPQAPAKAYEPSATNLTVHTKRNLESLEQQMRQAALSKTNQAERVVLNFEHQVIIGHVSLLTELISVTRPADLTVGKRNYILTADRDEHIRVSRGVPQAHVIEQFCFGHTSFVSSLCVPSFEPKVLVSGGGDNYLLVWDWLENQILHKVQLPGAEGETTVRGIWDVSLKPTADNADPVKAIFVALEGSAQLLCYTLKSDNSITHQDTLQLSGNVLALIGLDSRGSILVAVDTLRESDSISAWRSSSQPPLEAFRFSSGKWAPVEDSMVANINSEGTSSLSTTIEEKQQKELNDSMYNLGNLRKRDDYDE
ncbi:WD40/YVTN repeat-like-containing domain [Penicillium digitatum]|uniref:WD40/YVTN repeat-like-containing domain n=1 Tax=Penicillium digitatum TaxID=36651 RepID=A0A7T6XEA9_PENDI|nr:WD40/YVTN repeat-like-containing domain [Penicillium digitatum]